MKATKPIIRYLLSSSISKLSSTLTPQTLYPSKYQEISPKSDIFPTPLTY